jgi:hypothetical protein
MEALVAWQAEARCAGLAWALANALDGLIELSPFTPEEKDPEYTLPPQLKSWSLRCYLKT